MSQLPDPNSRTGRADRQAVLTRDEVMVYRQFLSPFLTTTNLKYFDGIVRLLATDGTANLALVLETLVPSLPQDDALRAIRNLRIAINKAASEARHDHFTLSGDSKKKNDPSERTIWFEGESPGRYVELPAFSAAGTIRSNEPRIVNQAEVTSGQELIKTARGRNPADVESVERFSKEESEAQRGLAGGPRLTNSAAPASLSEVSRCQNGELPSTTLEKLGVPAVDALYRWVRDENAQPFAVILGGSGEGKTVTSDEFNLRCLEERAALRAEGGDIEQVPLPIFIDLTRVQARTPNGRVSRLRDIFDKVISDRQQKGGFQNLSSEVLLQLIRDGGVVLILDGLDEPSAHLTVAEAQEFLLQILDLFPLEDDRHSCRTGRRRSRLVISCRTHFFATLGEQQATFAMENKSSVRVRDYQAFVMLPFSPQQVEEYLYKFVSSDPAIEPAEAKKRVAELMLVLNSIHNLGELAQRPLLLSLIAPELVTLAKLKADGKPINAAALYRRFFERCMLRDRGKQHFAIQHKFELMEELAAEFWRSNEIEWPWARLSSWLTRTVANHEEMRLRYPGISFEFLEEDLRTSTFLVRPITSEDRFRFAHASFREFFLACWLYRALRSSDPSPAWGLQTPSKETFAFLGQLLQLEPNAAPLLASLDLAGRAGGLAAFNVLTYKLLAIRERWPEPKLDALDLQGQDFSEREIHGLSRQEPLTLFKPNFAGVHFLHCDFRFVTFHAPDFSGAMVRHASFEHANLTRPSVDGADFAASMWRNCHFSTGVAGVAGWAGAAFCGTTGVSPTPPLETQGMHYELFPVTGNSSGYSTDPLRKITTLAMSDDESRAITCGSDGECRVWDLGSGRCVISHRLFGPDVKSVLLSADGSRCLALTEWGDGSKRDVNIKVWDIGSASLRHCLSFGEEHTGACSMSANGRFALVVARFKESGKLWDVETGELLADVKSPARWVKDAVVDEDGMGALLGFENGSLIRWDRTEDRFRELVHFSGSPSGAMKNESEAGVQSEALSLAPEALGIKSAITLGQRVVAAGLDSQRESLSREVGWAISRSQSYALSWDKSPGLSVWNLTTNRCDLILPITEVSRVSLTSDGRSAIVGNLVYDLATGELEPSYAGRHDFEEHTVVGHTLVATTGRGRELRILNRQSGRCRDLMHPSTNVGGAITQDGRTLATIEVCDSMINLWDTATGKINGSAKTSVGLCHKWVSFSLGGARLTAQGCGNYQSMNLQEWDLKTGAVARVNRGGYSGPTRSKENSSAIRRAADALRKPRPYAEATVEVDEGCGLVRLYEAKTRRLMGTFAILPGGERASCLEPGIPERAGNWPRLWATPRAWRWLAWKVIDPNTNEVVGYIPFDPENSPFGHHGQS